MNEKQKMLSGVNYDPSDQTLKSERTNAKLLCFKLNQSHPDDPTIPDTINSLLGYEADADLNVPFHCDYGYNIKVGKGFYANHGCTFLDCNTITAGDNCLLGPGVILATAIHPLDAKERASGIESALPITLGHDVWLGANVTVCPGVTIGNNVVVGAGSVVVKDLPANTVCVGNPAKVIRSN
ncbi:galactoside O-acetyltransferase [Vibrio sp. 10N.286.49.C2]|uniref:sugar O-acetyltransferase n=1 Tax=unclassified Vibrio TaxID=2614977 RepID=UPI000C85AC30|nr:MULTISPECIES: sugar O-acetyltransferase [unclassified Vibrio]PMH38185.1 galactoside O-acetyltransferase [Vibrio sp. 10N.286.49.C2]PMH53609.1 galactoside O-acetyltransferase [Vibrio sp. 10N.286.49.B1]